MTYVISKKLQGIMLVAIACNRQMESNAAVLKQMVARAFRRLSVFRDKLTVVPIV